MCVVCVDHANYCRECWEHWLLSCEERGLTAPTCPYCRAVLGDKQVQELIGRAYVPAEGVAPSYLDQVPVDVQFLAALRDLGYRCCTNCSAWVERDETAGSDTVECLCGERFCGECGTSFRTSNTCECNPSDSDSNDLGDFKHSHVLVPPEVMNVCSDSSDEET